MTLISERSTSFRQFFSFMAGASTTTLFFLKHLTLIGHDSSTDAAIWCRSPKAMVLFQELLASIFTDSDALKKIYRLILSHCTIIFTLDDPLPKWCWEILGITIIHKCPHSPPLNSKAFLQSTIFNIVHVIFCNIFL